MLNYSIFIDLSHTNNKKAYYVHKINLFIAIIVTNDYKMVIVYLHDRLGNNMWQIASAATLARRLNTDFVAYPCNSYCPDPDNCNFRDYIRPLKLTIFRKVQFIDDGEFARLKRVAQNNNSWHEIGECNLRQIEFNRLDTIFLNGYYSTSFDITIARDLFQIDDMTMQYIKGKYSFLFDDAQVWCAISIRRSDYLRLNTTLLFVVRPIIKEQ